MVLLVPFSLLDTIGLGPFNNANILFSVQTLLVYVVLTMYVVAVVQFNPPGCCRPPAGGTRQRTECFNLISRLTPLLPNPCVLACHSSRQLWYILIQWGDRRGYFTYTVCPFEPRCWSSCCRLLLMAITGFVIRHTQKINQHYFDVHIYVHACQLFGETKRIWEAAIFLENLFCWQK